ncbi:MAG: KTSC domain-containing protein [Bacteroidota bacterium]|nr:KTSC domain-containing protein [Bacteroidota bacterium]
MPSSVVANMDYDEGKATLRITYISGAMYDYLGVPPEVFEEMKAAGSKGKFLNYVIKGKYRYKKIRKA